MAEKKLEELLKGLDYKIINGAANVTVAGLDYDSRQCSPGTLFFCIPGFKVDGHDFVPEALARGASVIVVERPVKAPEGVTVVQVANARLAMGLISAEFYEWPTKKVSIAGVTGTNGKTSVAFLIDALHREMGKCSGLLGTVENRIGDELAAVKRTTPEALDLQMLLARMVEKGCSHAVMEVSSHAVHLKRIAGCLFHAALFTNLTQDHLDFHKSMDEYFDSKKKLFIDYIADGGFAILNADDPASEKIAAEAKGNIVRFSVNDSSADVFAEDVKSTLDGISYRIVSKFADAFDVVSPLMGAFNVYNTLTMAAYGLATGASPQVISETMKKMSGVPGRFQRIDEGQPFRVFVDYAHTPDGMLNILKSARKICKGRLVVVFGAGGDRDKTKRPLMGAVAAENADFAVITSDNPRTEDPDTIIDQIELGVEQAMVKGRATKRFKYKVERDRYAAIRFAIRNAEDDDVIIIAGKGHEDYQIFKDRTIFFDDREVAKNLLKEMAADGPDKN